MKGVIARRSEQLERTFQMADVPCLHKPVQQSAFMGQQGGGMSLDLRRTPGQEGKGRSEKRGFRWHQLRVGIY